MSPKRKPNILFKIFLSNGSLLILGVLTAWLGFATAKEVYKNYEAKRGVDKLKDEIQALEKKNLDLASLIDSFSDPEIIELEAKRRLNLKKPGEEVAVILRDKNDELQNIVQDQGSVMEDSATPEDKEPSNPIKWWRYITRD